MQTGYMGYNKLPLVFGLFLLLSFTATNAQSLADNYTDHSLTLRSDNYSKSALVSNLFSDRTGNMSPLIGVAAWADSGRQLQCRSLLKFNYLPLPASIINDPSQITLAELILYPVQVNDFDKPGKFIVRRVLESWEDSTTVWMNQPASDSISCVVKIPAKKQKDKPVGVDVTRLVMDMLRYGNKGFMICNDSLSEQLANAGQWFASPKYANENLRPILVINFRTWHPYSLQQFERESENRIKQTQKNIPLENTNRGPVVVANPLPNKD